MDEYYVQDKIEELTIENSELKQKIERLESRINKTNSFIGFATLAYMCAAIAKFIAVLIMI